MHHYVHHAQPTFCAWGVMDSSLPRRLADVEPQLKPKLCSFSFFKLASDLNQDGSCVADGSAAQPYTCGFPFKFSISCKSAKSRRSSIGLKKARPWWWVGVGAIAGHNPSYLQGSAHLHLACNTTNTNTTNTTKTQPTSLFGQCAKILQEAGPG